MELSATGKVILGMLAARPRSGYEIKQLVDKSARFFWAASYGQIYPELKKLEDAGLIAGTDASQGAPAAHRLQADGRRARRAAEELDRERAADLRASRRGAAEALLRPTRSSRSGPPRSPASGPRGAAATAAELRAIWDAVERQGQPEGPDAEPDIGSLTVLRYGIESNEWAAEWFERAAEDLERVTTGAIAAAGR